MYESHDNEGIREGNVGEEPALIPGRAGDYPERPFEEEAVDSELYTQDIGAAQPDLYELRIWEHPIPNQTYAIGADPGEGLPDGNDSAAEVICVESGFQVAELQGKIPPHSFGEMLYALGFYYNIALLGCERGQDKTPLDVLFQNRYPRIYYEVRETGEAFGKPSLRLGWDTNFRSRSRICNQARKFMTDGSVTPLSPHLLGQMETFALVRVGMMMRYQAIPGALDDLVMAWNITNEMFRICLLIDQESNNPIPAFHDGQPITEWGQEVFDSPTIKKGDDVETKRRKTIVEQNIRRQMDEHVNPGLDSFSSSTMDDYI